MVLRVFQLETLEAKDVGNQRLNSAVVRKAVQVADDVVQRLSIVSEQPIVCLQFLLHALFVVEVVFKNLV